MKYPLQVKDLQEIYDQCRFVLEVLGKPSYPGSQTFEYLGHRLHIRGSISKPELLVLFHAGQDETDRPLHAVLKITDEGCIHAYRPVWLSEATVGLGTNPDPTLPWTNWLQRAYKEAWEQVETEDEP